MRTKKADYFRDWWRRRAAARIADGKCTKCGSHPPYRIGGRVCQVCLDVEKSKRAIQAANGICHDCGGQLTGQGKRCLKCLQKAKARYYAGGRIQKLAKAKEYRVSIRAEVYAAYGGAFCRCCGESHVEFLSIDHVNNDGAAHRRGMKMEARGGLYMCRWLKKNGYPDGFQVLCFNCNLAKGHFGECPHRKETKSREIDHGETIDKWLREGGAGDIAKYLGEMMVR